jgi:small subunit ribosomal protein S15
MPIVVKIKINIMSNNSKIDKQPIIQQFRKSDADTGSSEVQIALLTARITQLTDHLRIHRKDYHSRRGLIALASRRRKLLDYVKRHDLNKYKHMLEQLKLRR